MAEARASYRVRGAPDADVANTTNTKGHRGRRPRGGPSPLRADPRLQVVVADFPGCKPVRVSRQEIDSLEVRLEYWLGGSLERFACAGRCGQQGRALAWHT